MRLTRFTSVLVSVALVAIEVVHTRPVPSQDTVPSALSSRAIAIKSNGGTPVYAVLDKRSPDRSPSPDHAYKPGGTYTIGSHQVKLGHEIGRGAAGVTYSIQGNNQYVVKVVKVDTQDRLTEYNNEISALHAVGQYLAHDQAHGAIMMLKAQGTPLKKAIRDLPARVTANAPLLNNVKHAVAEKIFALVDSYQHHKGWYHWDNNSGNIFVDHISVDKHTNAISVGNVVIIDWGGAYYKSNPKFDEWVRTPKANVIHHIVTYMTRASTSGSPNDYGYGFGQIWGEY